MQRHVAGRSEPWFAFVSRASAAMAISICAARSPNGRSSLDHGSELAVRQFLLRRDQRAAHFEDALTVCLMNGANVRSPLLAGFLDSLRRHGGALL